MHPIRTVAPPSYQINPEQEEITARKPAPAAASRNSMLQLSCLSGLGKLDVVADCDADGSCGGGGDPCLLHSELCCPNDSLDDDTVVIEIIQDEELLKDDLAIHYVKNDF